MPEAVIVDTIRTPIGRAFKGSLAQLRPDELGAFVIDAAAQFGRSHRESSLVTEAAGARHVRLPAGETDGGPARKRVSLAVTARTSCRVARGRVAGTG